METKDPAAAGVPARSAPHVLADVVSFIRSHGFSQWADDVDAALSAAEGARAQLEKENEELKAMARIQPTATLPSDVHADTAIGEK